MGNPKFMKKLGALGMAGILTLAVAACGGGGGSGSGSVAPGGASSGGQPQETVTITMYGPTSGFTSGVVTNKVFEEIARRTGVQVDIDFVYSEEKYASMMASNSLPDISFFPDNTVEFEQYVTSGLALPMDDLLESHGQNILKYAGEMVQFSRDYQSGGTGKCYFLNHQVSAQEVMPAGTHVGPILRWDYYKEIGAPPLTSDRDFVDVVVQLLEKYPTNEDGLKNVGISLWSDWGKWTPFCWGAYALNLNETYWPYTLDKGTNEIVDVYGEDGQFRYGMEFLNYAYRMGALDPDSFTQKIGDVSSKAATAQIIATILDVAGDGTKYLEGKGLEGKGYTTQLSPIAIEGTKNAFYYYTPTGRAPYWTISASTKYPEACMKFLNELYNPEMFDIMINGFEGEDWTLDGDGNRAYTAEHYDIMKNMPGPEQFQKYGWGGFAGSWSFVAGGTNPDTGKPFNIQWEDPAYFESSATSVQKDIWEYYGFPNDPLGLIESQYAEIPRDNSCVAWSMFNATTLPDDLKLIETNINLYLDKQYVKLAMCETEEAFEAEYAATMEELDNLGMQQLRDFLKPELDRILAEVGDKYTA